MPHYLLTGAGFSYNWGGWLASEAFEYLLGSNDIDDEMRAFLWANKEAGGGFEDALAFFQKRQAEAPHDQHNQQRLNSLMGAIVGMLNMMSNSMEQRPFEVHNQIQGS